jgi:hypothetical protein
MELARTSFSAAPFLLELFCVPQRSGSVAVAVAVAVAAAVVLFRTVVPYLTAMSFVLYKISPSS